MKGRHAFEGVPHPLTSVVMGAGMILSDLPLLRRVAWAGARRAAEGQGRMPPEREQSRV